MKDLIPAEVIEQKIYFIRKQKVMLDKDLAMLYQVPTKSLTEVSEVNGYTFSLCESVSIRS